MTYKEIQDCYKKQFNRTIKTCWIVDVKRQLGYNVKLAPNRQGDTIINKCPQHIIPQITQILKKK